MYGATADSVKYAWISAQRMDYRLDEMCRVLDVSASGYRSWEHDGKPCRKRLTDTQMLALIQAIHVEFKGAYGSPRMVRELRSRGFPASKERVERLMQENDIRAKHKRRFKVTTDSKHNLPIAPNLLDRNFTPDALNQVWTSDITYLWTDEGWLYLAIVIDLFNREIAMAFEYIEVFYNRKRLHSTLSYKSPVQFLSDWLNAPSPEKLVA